MRILTLCDFRKAVREGLQPASLVKATFGLKAVLNGKQEDSRVLTFAASDETVDRVGDVIRAAGWNLANYKKNPVFLWGHDCDSYPLGKCVEIGVQGTSLVGSVEFATAEINPESERVYQMYKGGFLSAVSVGFMPTRWQFMDEGDGIDFIECELWEFSAVTIPANPNALIQGRSAHKSKHAPASVYREYVQTRKECVS